MSFTTGNVKHWGLKMTPELLLMRGGINNPHFASVTEMKSRLELLFCGLISNHLAGRKMVIVM